MSSDLFHHPQEVLLAHFNMYVHHSLILFICQLKRHNQAKIIRPKSSFLFWLLDNAIIYHHIHRLELRRIDFVLILGHWFLFICFRSEKIQNLMREGGKKNILHIFGKSYAGDQINKTVDTFLEKLIWTTK